MYEHCLMLLVVICATNWTQFIGRFTFEYHSLYSAFLHYSFWRQNFWLDRLEKWGSVLLYSKKWGSRPPLLTVKLRLCITVQLQFNLNIWHGDSSRPCLLHAGPSKLAVTCLYSYAAFDKISTDIVHHTVLLWAVSCNGDWYVSTVAVKSLGTAEHVRVRPAVKQLSGAWVEQSVLWISLWCQWAALYGRHWQLGLRGVWWQPWR